MCATRWIRRFVVKSGIFQDLFQGWSIGMLSCCSWRLTMTFPPSLSNFMLFQDYQSTDFSSRSSSHPTEVWRHQFQCCSHCGLIFIMKSNRAMSDQSVGIKEKKEARNVWTRSRHTPPAALGLVSSFHPAIIHVGPAAALTSWDEVLPERLMPPDARRDAILITQR